MTKYSDNTVSSVHCMLHTLLVQDPLAAAAAVIKTVKLRINTLEGVSDGHDQSVSRSALSLGEGEVS